MNTIVARESGASSTVISTIYGISCYDFDMVHNYQDFRNVLYVR
jgi:hypothetical protein